MKEAGATVTGTPDLRLPDDLRQALHGHLETLRQNYGRRGWGRRSGYGARPAVVVIDLALAWTDPRYTTLGSDLDSVVEQTLRVLRVARAAGVPVFFTTMIVGPDDPPAPEREKFDPALHVSYPGSPAVELDPRLERRRRREADRQEVRLLLQGHRPDGDAGHRRRGYPGRHRLLHQPLRLRHPAATPGAGSA